MLGFPEDFLSKPTQSSRRVSRLPLSQLRNSAGEGKNFSSDGVDARLAACLRIGKL
jgi:hypothetical protein